MCDLDSIPTPCQETKPFPLKLHEITPENQVARQDPRYRGPEEGKDAKRTYSIEACTVKMDWPCHKMPDERLPKKVLYHYENISV